MIKSKRKIETTYTLEFDETYAEQLRLWLKWAFAVWQQCSYHQMLEGEIFHSRTNPESVPKISTLSHDSLLLFLSRLDRPSEE